MARLVAALALASLIACGARSSGPAWPQRQDPEEDGGESLAPRSASVVAASETKKDEDATVEKTDDKTDAKATDKPDEAKAADKPAGTTATPTEEVIIIDDIVIEIED